MASPPGSTASPEKRADLDFEVIDLRDYPLPLFNERGSLAWEPIKTEVAQRWAAKLAGLDGFILITPELLPGYLNFKES